MKKSISSIQTNGLHGPAGIVRLKKMLMLFLAAILLSAHAFAGATEMEATKKLRNALNKEFSGASEVKWYSDDNKTFMAKFTLNEHKVTAYFDGEGNLLATRRYIDEQQLPLAVATKLSKRYPDELVRWVVEFESGGNTVYYITLEGTKTWKVIKSDASGQMSVHQNLKKA